MAVRYSGDAEVRIRYFAGRYVGTVRDPFFGPWVGRCLPRLAFLRAPKSAEAYDDAAEALFLAADKASGGRLLFQKRQGNVVVERVFKAPCPIGPVPRLYHVRKTKRLGPVERFETRVADRRRRGWG